MFLPGCDAILDSSIWGHARYVYVSNLCLLYLWVRVMKKKSAIGKTDVCTIGQSLVNLSGFQVKIETQQSQ